MPNNTLNILTRLDGGTLRPLQRYMTVEGGNEILDFNKIVPLPDALNLSLDIQLNERRKTELNERLAENLKMYGFESADRWAVHHWGTKWNSYMVDKNGEGKDWTELRFFTAWEPPRPIIKTLAERTGLDLQLDFADEGGFWIGRLISKIDGSDEKIYKEAWRAPKDLKESFRRGEYSDKFKWTRAND